MLDQVHAWFGIQPDIDLNLMVPNQRLADFAAKALVEVTRVIEDVRPMSFWCKAIRRPR